MLKHVVAAAVLLNLFGCHGQEYGFECEGDETCYGQYLDEVDVEHFICDGTATCRDIVAVLNCMEDACKTECKGDETCYGGEIAMDNAEKLECIGFEACYSLEFVAASTTDDGLEVKCEGPRTCHDLDVEVISGRVKSIDCRGTQACDETEWGDDAPLVGVEKVECHGDDETCDADFYLEDVADGFEFIVNGDHTAPNFDLYLDFTASAEDVHVDKIECEGPETCRSGDIRIDNQSGQTLVIDELLCKGFEACVYLDVIVESGAATIKKCVCDSKYACLCATGLEICEEMEGEWEQDGTEYLSCD